MAATPSSSSPHHQSTPPTAPPPKSSRRLPPPCWSHDETVALIDAYCDKWYSLRRGNLRAPHWQEVADEVSARSPVSTGNPPKTSVQCRHKMEKLRKRYRSENQRALASSKAHRRFSSSWVHFHRMDSMEKGPIDLIPNSIPIGHEDKDDDDDENDNDNDDDDDEVLYQSVKCGVSRNNQRVHGSISNGIGARNGFRIKIPGRAAKFDGKSHSFANPNPNPNPHPRPNPSFVKRGGGGGVGIVVGGGGGEVGENRGGDLVAAIKALGEGFVRTERMKMEMAREVEAMRMDAEMKRTEMILQSQQRIVEAFAKAFSEKRNKRAKRMMTPPED